MQDIRRILFDVEIDQQEFLSIILDSYKREKPCYPAASAILTGY